MTDSLPLPVGADPDHPDLKARITFLTADEGGRSHQICNGYRPNLGGLLADGALKICSLMFEQEGKVLPGETVNLSIWLIYRDDVVGHVEVGQEISLQEGARAIGSGVVTAVGSSLKNQS